MSYVRARIEEHARRASVEPATRRAHATVQPPARADGLWRLHLEIEGQGQREVSAADCQALADAAALMVAISLQADVPTLEPAPSQERERVPPPPQVLQPRPAVNEPEPEPGPEPKHETAPAVDVEPATLEPLMRTPASSAGRPRAKAVLGVATGLHGVGLPELGAGLGVKLGVRWGFLRVAAFGMHWFERERAVQGDTAAQFRLTIGGLEGCPVLTLGRAPAGFELLACATLEAGVLWARGRGAIPSRTRRHGWVAPGGGLGAGWMLRPWLVLGLRADVVAPLLRRAFVIGDASAGRVGPVDVRGTLAVELRLPGPRHGPRKKSPRR